MADIQSSGGWVEVVAPGVNIALDPATMPHALVSEADGTFTFKRLAWDNREVGDDVTNPAPSFVGKRVNDVFFTRNRLGFLTGENVSMSRAGGLHFNFWRETATQVLDTDPIDVAATEKDLSILTSAVPFNEDILLFSPKTQFRFTSEQDLFTPQTVQMKPVSKFENAANCAPVAAGNAVYFAVDRKANSGVMEYTLDASSAAADTLEITEHTPRYLPPGLSKIVASTSERTLIAISPADPGGLFVYTSYTRGTERLQASWSRWPMAPGSNVVDIAIAGSEVVLLVQRADGLHLETFTLATGINDPDADFVTHLDRRITEAQVTMSYDAGAKITVALLPYAHDPATGGELQVWERLETGADRNPRRIHHARASATQIILPGDRRNSKFYVGVAYGSGYEFSEQFLRGDDGARTDGRLQLRRFAATTARTGGLVAEVYDTGRAMTEAVNLQTATAHAWSALKAFEDGPVKCPGVTLVMQTELTYAYSGEALGSFEGVQPDGRFYAQCVTGGGQVTTAQIGEGGAFSLEVGPGVKSINLVRLRDHAVVHSEVFGQEGPTGSLLVDPEGLLLVSPDAGLTVEAAAGGGGLLKAYRTDDLAFAARYLTVAQAKAVLAAVAYNAPDYAARWLRPIMATYDLASGTWPDEIDPATVGAVSGTGRSFGTQAWVALALAAFARAFPEHVAAEDARDSLVAAVAYLNGKIVPSGPLVGLLRLADLAAVDFEPNALAYFAFGHAAVALTDSSLNTKATAIGAGIERVLWQADDGRYALRGTEEGPSVTTGFAQSWIAPLFAARFGSTGRALLARQWFDYYAATEGAAQGYSPASADLDAMGAYSYGIGGVWPEATLQAAISNLALGDRAAARGLYSRVTPLLGEEGYRNAYPEGIIAATVPWADVAGTAFAVLAAYPNAVFGTTGAPLWDEGTVTISLNPPYRYTFVGDNPNDDGRFSWPVDAKSDHVRITVRNLGALPFAVLNAAWEGYFTARSQKV